MSTENGGTMTTKPKLWPFVSVASTSLENVEGIFVGYWWAEDDEHAKEQFKDSYPDAELLGIFYIPYSFLNAVTNE